MKKLLLLLSLFSCFLAQAQDTLKIATWNIEHLDYYKLMGYDTDYGYPQNWESHRVNLKYQATTIQTIINHLISTNSIDVLFINEIEPLTWGWYPPYAPNSKLANFKTQLTFGKYQYRSVSYFNNTKDVAKVKATTGITDPDFYRSQISYLGESYGIIYDTTKINNVQVRSVLKNPFLTALHSLPRPPIEFQFKFASGDSSIIKRMYGYHSSLNYPAGGSLSIDQKTRQQIDSLCTYLDGIILGDLNNKLIGGSPLKGGYSSIGNRIPTQGTPPYQSLDKILIKPLDANYLITNDTIAFYKGIRITIDSVYTPNLYRDGNAIKMSDHILKWASFQYGGYVTISKDSIGTDTLFLSNRGLNLKIPSDSLFVHGDHFKGNDTLKIRIAAQQYLDTVLLDTFVVIDSAGNFNNFLTDVERIADQAKQKGDTIAFYNIQFHLYEWYKNISFEIQTFSNPELFLSKEKTPQNNTVFYSNSGINYAVKGDTIFFSAKNFPKQKDSLFITLIDSASTQPYDNWNNKKINITNQGLIDYLEIGTAQAISTFYKQKDSTRNTYYLKAEQYGIIDTLTFSIETFLPALVAISSSKDTQQKDSLFVGNSGLNQQIDGDTLFFWGTDFRHHKDSIYVTLTDSLGNEKFDSWKNRIVMISDQGKIESENIATAQKIADTYEQKNNTLKLYHLIVKQDTTVDELNFKIQTNKPTVELTDHNDENNVQNNQRVLAVSNFKKDDEQTFTGLSGLQLKIPSDTIYLKGKDFDHKADTLYVQIENQSGESKLAYEKIIVNISDNGVIPLSFIGVAQDIAVAFDQQEDTKDQYYAIAEYKTSKDTIPFFIQRNIKPELVAANTANTFVATGVFSNKYGENCDQAGDDVYYNGKDFPEKTNESEIVIHLYEQSNEGVWVNKAGFNTNTIIQNGTISKSIGSAENILSGSFGYYKIVGTVASDSVENCFFSIIKCIPSDDPDDPFSPPIIIPRLPFSDDLIKFIESELKIVLVSGTTAVLESTLLEALNVAIAQLVKEGVITASIAFSSEVIIGAATFVGIVIAVDALSSEFLKDNKSKYSIDYSPVNSNQMIITGEFGNILKLMQKSTDENKQELTFLSANETEIMSISQSDSINDIIFTTIDSVANSIPQITEISTVQDLYKLNNSNVDNVFKLMNDLDATDTKNWNSGEGFQPIQNFSGTFDGNGFLIKNLYINNKNNNVAFISNTSGKSILENVHLDSLTLIAGATSEFAAGLIAINSTNDDVIVNKCSVKGTIQNNGNGSVSGLVGGSSNNNISITQSFFSGTITSTSGNCSGLSTNAYSIKNSYVNVDFSNSPSNVPVFGVIKNCHFLEKVYIIGKSDSDKLSEMAKASPNQQKSQYVYSYFSGDFKLTNPQNIQYDKSIEYDGRYAYYLGENSLSFPSESYLKMKATYQNWDFKTIWTIDEGVSFPKLRWQTEQINKQ